MGAGVWTTVPLSDIAALDINRVPIEPGVEYPVAGVMIAGQGLFSRPAITSEQTKYPAFNRLGAEQLVYRKLTAWEGPITVVPTEFAGSFVSSEFPTFTLDKTRLLPEFMKLTCQRPSFHDEMRLRSTGTAERRNRLKPVDLLDIQVSLPPLDDQRLIVEVIGVLDDAIGRVDDHLRAAKVLRERLLATTYELLSEASDSAPLGELADVFSGMSWSKDDERPDGTGIPALRVANVGLDGVDLGELRWLEVPSGTAPRLIQPSSLVLVRTNTADRVGNAQFLPMEAVGLAYSSFLIQVTPKDIHDAALIGRFLQAPQIQAQATDRARGTSASLTNIPVTWLRQLEVPLPDEAERRSLLEPIDAVEADIDSLHEEAAQLRSIRTSALEALLSGRRRVRKPHSATPEPSKTARS